MLECGFLSFSDAADLFSYPSFSHLSVLIISTIAIGQQAIRTKVTSVFLSTVLARFRYADTAEKSTACQITRAKE